MIKRKLSKRKRKTRALAIRMKLAALDYTCADLAKEAGMPEQALRNALYEPHEQGECVIADKLKVHPKTLWPERFSSDGIRLNPQPRDNYRIRGLARQCQKNAATLTCGEAA